MQDRQDESEDIAVSIARRTLVGKQVIGIIFGHDLAILIDNLDRQQNAEGLEGQAFLTLSGPWLIVKQLPNDQPEISSWTRADMQSQILMVGSLAFHRIQSVTIGTSTNDLVLQFDDGRWLVAAGSNDGYEAWHIGLKNSQYALHAIDGDIAIMGVGFPPEAH